MEKCSGKYVNNTSVSFGATPFFILTMFFFSAFARVKLDAGEYVLVATTFKPGEETSFTISVCSDVEGVKLSPISQ